MRAYAAGAHRRSYSYISPPTSPAQTPLDMVHSAAHTSPGAWRRNMSHDPIRDNKTRPPAPFATPPAAAARAPRPGPLSGGTDPRRNGARPGKTLSANDLTVRPTVRRAAQRRTVSAPMSAGRRTPFGGSHPSSHIDTMAPKPGRRRTRRPPGIRRRLQQGSARMVVPNGKAAACMAPPQMLSFILDDPPGCRSPCPTLAAGGPP
jgi:hypothetical protein